VHFGYQQVKTWAKVNEGMIKMYKAEVLGKLPVVQHFYFGKLLPFPDISGLDEEEAEQDEHGHIHAKGETGWTMDCCGIPGKRTFISLQLYRCYTLHLTKMYCLCSAFCFCGSSCGERGRQLDTGSSATSLRCQTHSLRLVTPLVIPSMTMLFKCGRLFDKD
jgi:hypothetical protein